MFAAIVLWQQTRKSKMRVTPPAKTNLRGMRLNNDPAVLQKDVIRLRRENADLTVLARELTKENSVLQSENAALKSEIGFLNSMLGCDL